MSATPDRVSLASALNLTAVAVLLWIAIGITCEITTRLEDDGRVTAYQKWLLNCLTNPGQDKTCHDTTDHYANDIRTASTQVRNFNSLNSVGATDRCNIATVFASPIGAFQEDCLRIMSGDRALQEEIQNKHYRRVYEEVLAPGWLSFSGPLFALDQRAFTAGAVGLMVGLFNDRVFGLLDGVVRPKSATAPAADPAQTAPAAAPPASAVAATNRVAEIAALAAAKSALETATAKAKSKDPTAPQALSDALSAFRTAETAVKKT